MERELHSADELYIISSSNWFSTTDKQQELVALFRVFFLTPIKDCTIWLDLCKVKYELSLFLFPPAISERSGSLKIICHYVHMFELIASKNTVAVCF